MNYTHAYGTFAIRSCLNPDLPNNFGSPLPIRVTAPEGSIGKAKSPSPVNARHVVGMYVPFPILKALHAVLPERVLAEIAGAVWTIQIQGRDASGILYTSSLFNYSGGMGARKYKDGPSATCYPTGITAVPVEIREASLPLVFEEKRLRPGSGGAGRSRGGDGQVIRFRVRTGKPWLLNAIPSRVHHAAEGLEGGGSGKAGRFLANGVPVSEARRGFSRCDSTNTMTQRKDLSMVFGRSYTCREKCIVPPLNTSTFGSTDRTHRRSLPLLMLFCRGSIKNSPDCLATVRPSRLPSRVSMIGQLERVLLEEF